MKQEEVADPIASDEFVSRQIMDDEDPFGPDEPSAVVLESRESIRSFWIGLAGLAILLHAVIYLELRVIGAIVGYLLRDTNNQPFRQAVWDAREAIHAVSMATLMPCIVLVTVIPLLYWRGGLLQRFALSGVLVVTAMNLSVNQWWQDAWFGELQGLFAIAGCWALFPILFLFTPIKTRPLRLVTATCMLILTVCVSVLHMNDLRGGFDILYWECVFGSAFLYALLKRNWGKVATMESGTTVDQIQRTSSRTLLELMAVSGLAFASVSYWTQSSLQGKWLYFVQASGLGVASALVSMSSLRRLMNGEHWKLVFLLIAFFLMSTVFYVNSMFLMVDRGYNQGAWGVLQKPSYIYPTLACSLGASLWLMVYLFLLSRWLKWCGWRVEVGAPSQPDA